MHPPTLDTPTLDREDRSETERTPVKVKTVDQFKCRPIEGRTGKSERERF